MRYASTVTALCLWAAFSAGCATAPKTALPPQTSRPSAQTNYHKVTRGQTLWRIARSYGMDVDELAELNGIRDFAKLEVGQQLIVPAARKAVAGSTADTDDDFIWPVRGKVIAGYSQTVRNAVNKGINIEPSRQQDVLASRGGKVAFYNDDFLDLGKTIILEHPNGFWTVYGRNQEVYVKPGDAVTKGMAIARAGGPAAEKNNYLHFEIRKGAKSENPLFYLP